MSASKRLLESPLCELVFSGRYTELLKRTVDSRSGTHHPDTTPFVVGALAFSGRQEEAIAAFRWWNREHGNDATIRVACHFFLCVGESRAGRYAAAVEHAAAAKKASIHGEPLHTFFTHQAIGLLRHFTGRARSASRNAAVARRAALEARFPYGRMLALDLLGHALVLEGQIHAGIAVLEQSAKLSLSLGLIGNAGGPRTAIAACRARFGIAFGALDELQDVMASTGAEDAYSRRMLLSELAIQRAFAGQGAAARATIDQAALIGLPDGDRRAKVRLLVADAIVTGFSRSAAHGVDKLALARTMLDAPLDDGLDVEVAWAEALVRGRVPIPEPERSRIEGLARRTGIGRARLLTVAHEDVRAIDPHGEDRVAALFHALRQDPLDARHRIVAYGLWGWLPRLFDVEPSRRLWLFHAESLLVVEDKGDIVALEMPGAVLVRLLEALSHGPTPKEELVRQVWGIRTYRAERHDSLVHTTISRLRAALGPAGAWIRVVDAGYTIADGVMLFQLDSGLVEEEAPERAPLPPAPSPPAPRVEIKPRATEVRRDRALHLCATAPLSTSEIALELKISEMTAFRLLSSLAKEGLLVRTGRGKRTRYSRTE